MLRGDDIATFIQDLSRRNGIVFERRPIDDFADAVTRLADSEGISDDTQRLLVALGRANIITGHDGVMLLAAYLRQKD